MKKLMISMLAMAAMVSCTNEIENPDQPKQALLELKRKPLYLPH